MTVIDREQLQTMLEEGVVTLVDVLDLEQYEDYHLPDAISVPLNDRFEEAIQETVPDRSTPVVVYCMDEDCDASPEAATRMEELGYERVYDYEAGKRDWKAAGLPVET